MQNILTYQDVLFVTSLNDLKDMASSFRDSDKKLVETSFRDSLPVNK